jgi:hypothetical protein
MHCESPSSSFETGTWTTQLVGDCDAPLQPEELARAWCRSDLEACDDAHRWTDCEDYRATCEPFWATEPSDAGATPTEAAADGGRCSISASPARGHGVFALAATLAAWLIRARRRRSS